VAGSSTISCTRIVNWNKQNYNNPTIQADGFFLPGAQSITATSAVDKLNGYRKVGDIATVSYEMKRGILRAGLWFEWAYTDRYQTPSDPRTWQDSALPNFHEHFITTSAQPFVEYEYNITHNLSVLAGVKVAQYGMSLTQFQDNGKTGVGCVGGVLSTPKVTQTTVCIGGQPSSYHDAQYRSWMPAASLRYKIKNNWTAYAQFGTGSNIPPSSVFDFAANGANVNGASSAIVQVGVLPKPTTVKTYQLGTVLKFNRWTIDFDGYYSHFQNPYSNLCDNTTGECYFYQTGPSNTRGVEAESNVLIGHGFSLYLNGTLGSAKYQEGAHFANGGLWIANTPKNTEAVGLTYQQKSWDIGIFNKRVGTMYNDNGSINQAVTINPFNVTNLFFNYTVKGTSFMRGSKLRFAINNLFDDHSIVGVALFNKNTTPSPADFVTLVPARSVSVTMTFGYAPSR